MKTLSKISVLIFLLSSSFVFAQDTNNQKIKSNFSFSDRIFNGIPTGYEDRVAGEIIKIEKNNLTIKLDYVIKAYHYKDSTGDGYYKLSGQILVKDILIKYYDTFENISSKPFNLGDSVYFWGHGIKVNDEEYFIANAGFIRDNFECSNSIVHYGEYYGKLNMNNKNGIKGKYKTYNNEHPTRDITIERTGIIATEPVCVFSETQEFREYEIYFERINSKENMNMCEQLFEQKYKDNEEIFIKPKRIGVGLTAYYLLFSNFELDNFKLKNDDDWFCKY